MLDREALLEGLPPIGPEVVGASYCPLDGQCNSLRLLYAFHVGMRQLGAEYLSSHAVHAIDYHDGVFFLRNSRAAVRAEKVVLAAGIGNARLAPMVGLKAPVRPQRGQVVLTERPERFLAHPLVTIRQTDEGTVMLGDSQEEAGLDDSVGLGVTS